MKTHNMDKALQDKFVESYDRIQNVLVGDDRFYDLFYRRLLSTDENFVPLFEKTDFQKQHMMLNKALFIFYTYLINKIPVSELDHIKEIHKKMDLHLADFQIWGSCMIATIEDHDPKFDQMTRDAWQQVIDVCIEYIASDN